MLKPEGDPWFKKFFRRGVNKDISPLDLPDDQARDAQNMRPLDVNGFSGAMTKIGGEATLYAPNVTGASTFDCVGACNVNGRVMSFWASPTQDPLVQLDDIVVAQSPNIPYTYNHMMQMPMTVQEGCNSGVVFPVDGNSRPLYWDVEKLLTNYTDNTGLYFGGYTTDINAVDLAAAATWPVLDRLNPIVDLGGSSGLMPGLHVYSMRYVDANGNRSNWSPETPPIPVPQRYTPEEIVSYQQGSNYPGGRTFGGPASSTVPTQYGLRLRMWVDNQYGFSSIEIRRQSYIGGVGLFGTPIDTIVYRIGITPGQNEIIEYIDPGQQNQSETVVPDQVDTISLVNPEASEFANGRLIYANSDVDAQPTGITVSQSTDGRYLTSITKALNKDIDGQLIPDGYSNPWNNAYMRSAMRGDKYTYGISAWNGAMGKFYSIVPDELKNYQHPNRRDIKGVNGAWAGATNPNGWGENSGLYSDDPIYAATNDLNTPPVSAEGNVGSTFEIMTQGTTTKTDTESLVNVMVPNGNATARPADQFNRYGNITPNEVVFATDPVQINDFAYKPWDPPNNSGGLDGYAIPPNVARMTEAAGTGGDTPPEVDPPFVNQVDPYNPLNNAGKIFAPTYQALGALISGIENIPNNVSAITISRSQRAGRVVMQGFGTYDLRNTVIEGDGTNIANYHPAQKSTASLSVHFPDIQSGVQQQALIDDIQANPSKYRVQFPAGFGFYNETYGYWARNISAYWGAGLNDAVASSNMDQIYYARIMEDHGQVNVGESQIGQMGYRPLFGSGAPDGNYVGQDKWRSSLTMDNNFNIDSKTGSFWQNEGTGNALFNISSLVTLDPVRGRYMLSTNQFIYAPDCNDVVDNTNTPQTAFLHPDVKAFHQPWLVVNIVDLGADVPDQNSQDLLNTGCHIAMRRGIGYYTAPLSSPEQNFELLEWQEWYNAVGYLGTDYRYTYVQHPSFGERRYLCVTNNTQINYADIATAITNNGFWIAPDGLPVYGMYQALIEDGRLYLRFGESLYFSVLPIGARLVVKYPEGTPIRVWGHDIAIGPTTYTYITEPLTADADGSQLSRMCVLAGLPMPYAGFVLNPRYYMPETETTIQDRIYINFMAAARQMAVMWDCECVTNVPMYVNLDSFQPVELNNRSQMFPFNHYIIRPYQNVSYAPPTGFFPQYQLDYPDEWNIFDTGGLRDQPANNLDYSHFPRVEFKGLPQAGYEVRTDYCTTLWASNKFLATQQDNPGLRTFTQSNAYSISEENGQIWRIGSATGNQGQNMYGWTDRGVFRILTDKNILSTATGEDLVSQSLDGYWGTEDWLDRTVGMPGYLKHLWTRWGNYFWWADKRGIYQLGGGLGSISMNAYDSKILPMLDAVTPSYNRRMCSAYDPVHKEVWFAIPDMRAYPTVIATRMVVYNIAMKQWVGEFTYEGDQFLAVGQDMLGFRDLVTRTMNVGYVLNGEPLECWVESAFCPYQGMETEAVWFRDNPTRPSRIEIRDQNGTLMFETDAAIWGQNWVLHIDGYENAVGLTRPSYATPRRRVTSTTLFKRTIHNEDVPFIEQISSLQLRQLV